MELLAGDTDGNPIEVGLVPLMLPAGIMLDAGARDGDSGGAGEGARGVGEGAAGAGEGAGGAAEAELGPGVNVAGAGVGDASEEEVAAATGGIKSKVVVAVATPLASTSTETMREAVTWTVTSTTAASCRGAIWRTSRLCMRPISSGSAPGLCLLDGCTIAWCLVWWCRQMGYRRPQEIEVKV